MRKIFSAGCASALAPHTVSATTIAKSPTHFRFSILDFQLSEKESRHRTQHLLFILFAPNRKSAIENVKFHLMTRFARSSTRTGIVSPICFAALRLMMNSNFVACCTGKSAGLAPFKILST
jgi:hypothetical protein